MKLAMPFPPEPGSVLSVHHEKCGDRSVRDPSLFASNLANPRNLGCERRDRRKVASLPRVRLREGAQIREPFAEVRQIRRSILFRRSRLLAQSA